MIRIGQLQLQPNHTEQELYQKLAHTLRVPQSDILHYEIRKQSIDARKKLDIKYVYTIDVAVANERQVLKKQKTGKVTPASDKPYVFPKAGVRSMPLRPIIIGSGPAGMFCAYLLAEHGYRPIIFERGAAVDERIKDIEAFWNTGVLNTQSNVQFGEGGAGTFSDGKLNTLVKDACGRNHKVLEIFVENGAPKEILSWNKPHIGTDILMQVVRNMRERILAWGGEIHFHSQLTDLALEQGKLSAITIESDGVKHQIPAHTLILAIGHSARDTFTMLYEKGLPLLAKSFAVGVRVEHPQQMINNSQYGTECPFKLPAASYKLATTLENGRGVYSFCMCPGGYVVNASSEEGYLAVNGMSYHARDGQNANSAMIVTVTPEDYKDNHPLAGMYFQRELEKKAYLIGNGNIPVQRFADFCKQRPSQFIGSITPQIKGAYTLANVRDIFPEQLGESIELGIKSFDRQIQGFANDDTIISGVESRTSSPVRIQRNENLEVENSGIFPCGEGAGYAGGITSAAMDGMKVAEMIATKFAPFDKD